MGNGVVIPLTAAASSSSKLRFLLASTNVRVSPALSTAQTTAGCYQPSFMLPAGTLDGQGLTLQQEESVLGTNWAANPYEAEGGALQNGSSVTSLSVGQLNITGLSQEDPIVLTLPLAVEASYVDTSVTQRRRLARGVDDDDEATSITINCTNITAHAEAIVVSEMAHDRAEFCGHSLFEQSERYAKLSRRLRKRNFYCPEIGQSYEFQCQNNSGLQTFTCPKASAGAQCQYWDAASASWSDDGCEYW